MAKRTSQRFLLRVAMELPMLIATENRDAVYHSSILLFFGLGRRRLNPLKKLVMLLGEITREVFCRGKAD